MSPTAEYVLESLWNMDWGEEYREFYHSFYGLNNPYPSNINYKKIRLAVTPHMRAKGFESDSCANYGTPGHNKDKKGCEECIARWRPIDRKITKLGNQSEEVPESSETPEEEEEKRQDPNPSQPTLSVRERESDKRQKKKGKKGKRASTKASHRM
jgi:hypothetical protein